MESEELWKEIQETVKNECEKRRQKIKKRKKANWMSKQTVEMSKTRRGATAKDKKKCKEILNQEFLVVVRRSKK